LAKITHVIAPRDLNGAKSVLLGVVDPEISFNRLEQEQVLPDLVLVEADCILE